MKLIGRSADVNESMVSYYKYFQSKTVISDSSPLQKSTDLADSR